MTSRRARSCARRERGKARGRRRYDAAESILSPGRLERCTNSLFLRRRAALLLAASGVGCNDCGALTLTGLRQTCSSRSSKASWACSAPLLSENESGPRSIMDDKIRQRSERSLSESASFRKKAILSGKYLVTSKKKPVQTTCLARNRNDRVPSHPCAPYCSSKITTTRNRPS